MEKDFQDWVYRTMEVTVRANETLKVFAGPEVSRAEFRKLCTGAARQKRDAEADKVENSFGKKIDSLVNRLSREERELAEDQTELSQRKLEEIGTHVENILGLFSKRRRRLSTSLTKRRMTERAKADLEESLDAIEDYKKQIARLEKDKAQALEDVKQKWSDIADDMTNIPVTPYKKDVLVDLFGVAWMPYHLVQIGEKTEELPGYGEG